MLKLQPKSLFVGQNQVYLPYCHSTNDVASESGQKENFFDGTIVFTDYQTGGRGQRGTQWESEIGKNLMMSLLMDTSFLNLDRHFDLSMCTALAIYKAISTLNTDRVLIKWPNDIYINNRKVGGVLIENSIREARLRYSVIGIGVNISQGEFRNERATSLVAQGVTVSRNLLAERICECFEYYFLQMKHGESLKELYLSCLLGLGEEREFISGSEKFTGIIRDISSGGQLVVESAISKKQFDIKEISFCF